MLMAWLRKGSASSVADSSVPGATPGGRKRPAADDVTLAPVPAVGTCNTTPTHTLTAAAQRRVLAYNQLQPELTNSECPLDVISLSGLQTSPSVSGHLSGSGATRGNMITTAVVHGNQLTITVFHRMFLTSHGRTIPHTPPTGTPLHGHSDAAASATTATAMAHSGHNSAPPTARPAKHLKTNVPPARPEQYLNMQTGARRAPVGSGGFRGGAHSVRVGHGRFYVSIGGGSGGGQASRNWRYITNEDQTGPRKDEHIISTTLAKERYHLSTSDLCSLQGLRRKGARSTLTM